VLPRLVARCDIVIENFRPGRLAEWGLGYDVLAFGSIGEAMGGIRRTTGAPDRPPSRTGVSLGDSLDAPLALATFRSDGGSS
jgi:formyl-CoA transferase